VTVVVWALPALAFDAMTKRVMTAALTEGRLYEVTPGYGVRLVHNRRASLPVAEAVSVLAVCFVAVLVAAPHGLTAVGLGLALGGAAGNVVDRLRSGAVVDFIAAGPWPMFNVADAAMALGLFLAAVSVL